MKTILLTCVSIMSAGLLQAAVIFDGTDGSLDFGTPTGMHTESGITVTLAANDGVVNATTGGLGINDSLTGDDTNGLDTINTTEVLTISFSVDVIVESFTFSDIGVNDGVEASFDGAPAISITSSGTTVFGTTLLAGEELTLTAFEPNSGSANNGVVITQFEVTQIPEPSSTALIGLSGLAFLLRRRR